MPYTTPTVNPNPGKFLITVRDATDSSLYAYVGMDFDVTAGYTLQEFKDFFQRIIDTFDANSDFATPDGQVQYFADSVLTPTP